MLMEVFKLTAMLMIVWWCWCWWWWLLSGSTWRRREREWTRQAGRWKLTRRPSPSSASRSGLIGLSYDNCDNEDSFSGESQEERAISKFCQPLFSKRAPVCHPHPYPWTLFVELSISMKHIDDVIVNIIDHEKQTKKSNIWTPSQEVGGCLRQRCFWHRTQGPLQVLVWDGPPIKHCHFDILIFYHLLFCSMMCFHDDFTDISVIKMGYIHDF